jgi:hypothetical protein
MTDGFYEPGDNYFICPVCGFKKRVSEGRWRWDKGYVCREDWEPRHPQESLKGRRDRIKPAISRPEPTDVFIDVADTTVTDL